MAAYTSWSLHSAKEIASAKAEVSSPQSALASVKEELAYLVSSLRCILIGLLRKLWSAVRATCLNEC